MMSVDWKLILLAVSLAISIIKPSVPRIIAHKTAHAVVHPVETVKSIPH